MKFVIINATLLFLLINFTSIYGRSTKEKGLKPVKPTTPKPPTSPKSPRTRKKATTIDPDSVITTTLSPVSILNHLSPSFEYGYSEFYNFILIYILCFC